MPGRFTRLLGVGELSRGVPFVLPLVNLMLPDLEPVPFQSALAVTVTLLAEIKAPSRFRFEMLAWLVALTSDELICPEALLLTDPELPTRGALNALALFCEEPPVQPIPAGDTGPNEVEPELARPLA